MPPSQSSRKRGQPPYGLILGVIGLLLIGGGVVLGLLLGGQGNPPAAAPPSPGAGRPAANIPFPAVARISLAEAKQRYDAGTAVFVDTRSAAGYAAGHIAGALLLGTPELDARLQSMPPEHMIITYCT